MRLREAFPLLLVVGTVMACSDVVRAADSPKSPREVVAEYCRLDADGALTSSDGWPTISPLFIWPDAPGWDTFTVVRSYSVGEATQAHNEATVPAEYELVGVLNSMPHFAPAKTQRVKCVFHLSFNNKHWVADADGNPEREVASGPAVWRITKPQNEPHVSLDRALKMAKDFVTNASDAETKEKAEAALKELEAAQIVR